MPEEVKPKTRDEVTVSIAVEEEAITDVLLELPKLFPEFSLEWLVSIEANYNSFLDYCECVIKKHQESKK